MPACWKTYWNCIAFELGTLCEVFFLFCMVLFYFIFPLWWDNYKTISEAPSPGLETEGWTPKLLRMKLYCIWTWRFFFIYLFFYFYFYFFLFLIFNPLSVSLMPIQLTVDWYSVSSCLYLWNFSCLFLCLFFLLIYLFIPFPLTSLLSISSHPSILNMTSAIITSYKILNCT
jgi:hypothetical protein